MADRLFYLFPIGIRVRHLYFRFGCSVWFSVSRFLLIIQANDLSSMCVSVKLWIFSCRLFPSAEKSEGLRLHLVSHLTRFNLRTCYFACSAHLASLKWLPSSYFGRVAQSGASPIVDFHFGHFSWNCLLSPLQCFRQIGSTESPIMGVVCNNRSPWTGQLRDNPRDCLSPVTWPVGTRDDHRWRWCDGPRRMKTNF